MTDVDWGAHIRPRLASLQFSPTRENEIVDELSQHLDDRWRELVAGGASPERAEALALAEFSDRETLTRRLAPLRQAQTTATPTPGAPTGSWLTDLWQDLGYAARMLRRQPGFSCVAVAVLAIGLGASTTVFSVVHDVLLRPLPFEKPHELVAIREGFRGVRDDPTSGASPPDFLAFRQRQRSYTDVAAYKSVSFEVSGPGEPEQLPAARVAAALFSVLGRQPMLGRGFTEAEEQGAAQIVVLGWGLWQRRFHADPSVVGKTIRLDRRPWTIVGVLPRTFEFPLRGPEHNAEPADLLVPLGLTVEQRTNYGSNFTFGLVARLKPGVSLEAARAEASALVPDIEARYPADMRTPGSTIRLAFTVASLKTHVVGEVTPVLLILFGAVLLVLLAACADLGGLLLTRAATRANELAVRAALGAGRGRLVRQLLTESLLIALAGAAIGLGLASAMTRTIATQAVDYLPRAAEIGLDATAVAGMSALTLLTAIVFGLAPALWATRVHGAAPTGRRATAGRDERRLLRTFVVAQVTLAVVLGVGAGLLVRSVNRLIAVDPGFRGTQAVAGRVFLPRATYADRRTVQDATERLLSATRALPGVRAAAIASTLPMQRDEMRPFVAESSRVGRRTPPTAVTWVMGSYFTALGIPLRQGRTFTDADGLGPAPVVIVNETLARRVWGSDSPVGQRIRWGLSDKPGDMPWMTVVGVVADVKQGALSSQTTAEVFEPLQQGSEDALRPRGHWYRSRRLALIARTDGAPDAMLAVLPRAVHRVDPEMPLTDGQGLDTLVEQSTLPQRFTTTLFSAFAVAAVVLAALGLYGMLSSFVAQRTREIGVRVALGAATRDVVMLIVRQGLALVLVGLVVGTAAALVATSAMKSLLFGVQPFDPITFAGVALTLTVVGTVASLAPAWRAVRVDPVSAIRAD
jgi:putative ABC transport system permease protein